MKVTKTSFSHRLTVWLDSNKPKTLQQLVDKFGEKSFGILFLLLMAIPALPLPTGGVTHIFEIMVMLLALELIAGKRVVWLPKIWQARNLPTKLQTTALPALIKLIKKIERFSRPRLEELLNSSLLSRFIGLVVFIFSLFAFLAPPFSGLDTLPSLGVVLIALGILLDDLILSFMGLFVGLLGIGLVIAIGSLVFRLI